MVFLQQPDTLQGVQRRMDHKSQLSKVMTLQEAPEQAANQQITKHQFSKSRCPTPVTRHMDDTAGLDATSKKVTKNLLSKA